MIPPHAPSDDIGRRLDPALQHLAGTRIDLSYADGDIWDWAVDWDEWVSMSALSTQKPPAGIPASAPATPSGAPTLSGTPTTTPALTPGG